MTFVALLPLIVGCAVAGSIITWPIAVAAGRRSVSDAGRARDAAEVARLAANLYPAGAAPAAVEAPPLARPAGHRGQHRRQRTTLRGWWAAIPVRDVDAPVRAALDRMAAPVAIAGGVAVAEGGEEVELLRLATDWRARGTGPIPVVQVFSDHVELASAAA